MVRGYTIYHAHNDKIPTVDHLSSLASKYSHAVFRFTVDLVHWENVNTEEVDEINRIQQIFDGFGQLDPNLEPAVLAQRLRSLKWRRQALVYIIHWALITNTAVDGDIKYTLLPPHVVALYRDLDRHSKSAAHPIWSKAEGIGLIINDYLGSDTHRLLNNRWIELTFGLLAGGHSGYQASAEAGRRIDRIRQFLTKLLEPYCVQRRAFGSFSERLDEVLQLAVAIGYHLLGAKEQYRWDWTWLEPKSKELGRIVLGKPPPRPPPEEEVPEGIWIMAPALVKETGFGGQQLAQEITLYPATQSELNPKEIQFVEIGEEEFQKAIAAIP